MIITTADIANAASAAITGQVDGPAGSFFRRVFNMRFETGGTPDGIAIDTDALTFGASFAAKTYNLLSGSGPIQAVDTEEPDSSTVLIRLDRPWRIKSVSLKTSFGARYMEAVSMAGAHAGYSWTCAAAPGNVTIDAEYLDAHEQLAWQRAVTIQLFRVDGEAVAEEPTATVASGSTIFEDFISPAFALRAMDNTNEPIDLSLADISAIEIETFPTGPRIGILGSEEADDPSNTPVYFWQVPGEVRDDALYDAQNENAAAAFAGALQRYLDDHLDQLAADAEEDDLPYSVPEHLELALVVDSDAPCQSEMDINVAYYLVRKTFTIPESSNGTDEKQVLRFEGQPTESGSVDVTLPQTAVISSAVLEMDASFGCPPAAPVGDGVDPIPTAASNGVQLTMDRWAAQSLALTEALTLAEVAIGVMALETETELSVVVRADHAGSPDGLVLAEQQVTLSAAGVRQYARIALDEILALSGQHYWILAKALTGSAIWLTRNEAQSRMVTASTTSSGGISTSLYPLDGIQGYLALFSRSTQACPAPAPLTLKVGATDIALTPAENGRLRTDGETFTNGLNDCLVTPTDDCTVTPEGLTIPMQFTAASKGMVTVYAPELRFDI